MLREDIESGAYLPGNQIPTERELSKKLSVSTITVKQAIQKLVNEGFLNRRQGKGTYVSQLRVQRKLTGLISFHDEMLQRGFVPSTRLLDLRVIPARRVVTEALQLPENAKVLSINRLRLADGEVMAVQRSYLPYDLCPGLADNPDSLMGSLYKVLRQNYNLEPVRGRETYEAVAVIGHDAHILGVPEGSVAFSVKRYAYMIDNRAIEYVESLLRADRYALNVELPGE